MNVAIVAAAGRGTRMASTTSKQFLLLDDRPVLAHTLAAFEAAASIDAVIIVGKAKDIEACKTDVVEAYGFTKVTNYVIGGHHRQDSVNNALKLLPSDAVTVVVHDGARPLVTPELIDRAVAETKHWPAVIPGIPVKDTIKRVTTGEVVEYTIDRGQMWAIQTPQAFKADVLIHAHRVAKQAKFYGTDDATLVEKINHPIRVIPGSEENIKITTPIDLIIAEAIVRARRQGPKGEQCIERG
jgi:2-C-methyl-D-erythritol 4-phosphate cytidylyltransferase